MKLSNPPTSLELAAYRAQIRRSGQIRKNKAAAELAELDRLAGQLGIDVRFAPVRAGPHHNKPVVFAVVIGSVVALFEGGHLVEVRKTPPSRR